MSSDIGRPLTHCAQKFADENLMRDAEAVLKKLATIEAEVPSDSGHWYARRMLSYRTQDNRIAGIVITFNDITELKRASEAANEARLYSEAIVATIRQPLLVLDGELRVQSANSAFREHFGLNEKETEGRAIHEIGVGQWNIPSLRSLPEEVLAQDRAVVDLEVGFHSRPSGIAACCSMRASCRAAAAMTLSCWRSRTSRSAEGASFMPGGWLRSSARPKTRSSARTWRGR